MEARDFSRVRLHEVPDRVEGPVRQKKSKYRPGSQENHSNFAKERPCLLRRQKGSKQVIVGGKTAEMQGQHAGIGVADRKKYDPLGGFHTEEKDRKGFQDYLPFFMVGFYISVDQRPGFQIRE